jgi:hypothetical protein
MEPAKIRPKARELDQPSEDGGAAERAPDPERPLSAIEASELLGYATEPPQTVQKLCREGKLKHWRAGKEIRTLRRWVIEYRDSIAVGGGPDSAGLSADLEYGRGGHQRGRRRRHGALE